MNMMQLYMHACYTNKYRITEVHDNISAVSVVT